MLIGGDRDSPVVSVLSSWIGAGLEVALLGPASSGPGLLVSPDSEFARLLRNRDLMLDKVGLVVLLWADWVGVEEAGVESSRLAWKVGTSNP